MAPIATDAEGWMTAEGCTLPGLPPAGRGILQQSGYSRKRKLRLIADEQWLAGTERTRKFACNHRSRSGAHCQRQVFFVFNKYNIPSRCRFNARHSA